MICKRFFRYRRRDKAGILQQKEFQPIRAANIPIKAANFLFCFYSLDLREYIVLILCGIERHRRIGVTDDSHLFYLLRSGKAVNRVPVFVRKVRRYDFVCLLYGDGHINGLFRKEIRHLHRGKYLVLCLAADGDIFFYLSTLTVKIVIFAPVRNRHAVTDRFFKICFIFCIRLHLRQSALNLFDFLFRIDAHDG